MIGGGRIAVVVGRAVAVFAVVALTACVEEFPTLVGIEVEMTSLSTADVSPRSIWGEPERCTLIREVWIGDEVDRYERTLEGGRYERIVFEGVPLPLDTVGMPIEADGTIPPGTWATSHALAMRCTYDDGSEQNEYRNVRRPFPRFERIEPRADLTTVQARFDVALEFVAELPVGCELERRAVVPDGYEDVERRIATPSSSPLRFEAVPLVPPTMYDGLYEVPTVHDVLVRCDYRVEGGAWSQEDSFSVTAVSAEP